MKLKLEPAAALMLEWGKRAFRSDIVDGFIDCFDLATADELLRECNSICNWYGEAIINRNFFINTLVDGILKKGESQYLIIILAAGKSPHSLQFVLQNPEKVNQILEIDFSGMDEKKLLYDTHFPQVSKIIKCITADIKSRGLLTMLNSILHEYYLEIPSITILEGISHLLSQKELENIITGCLTSNKNNVFILDYLLPPSSINPIRVRIPNEINNIMRKHGDAGTINSLSREEISSIFEKYSGRLLRQETMTEIELQRTGNNKYFLSQADGWFECAAWKI